jgi:VWFA-related protein
MLDPRKETPMKYSLAFRYFVVFLFVAGMFLTVPAQSGRKRQAQTPSSTTQNGGQNQRSAEKGGEKATEKEDDRKTSNRPLADNTPTTVTDDGTIKLETALVTIPASVSDREGRFIPNLKKRDFRIYEDGVEQEIESFQSVETPFHVVLLLDTSASTRFRLEDIHEAAITFVNRLRWDDKVIIASFDNDIEVFGDFTSDREQLRDAIYRTRTGGSTKLYEAVDLSLNELLGPIKGRKAIVLFTDGVDTSSRRSSARSTIAMVEEADALVFPIRYDTEGDNPQGGVIMGNPRAPFPWPRSPRVPRGRNPRFPFPFEKLINFQFPGQWPQGRVPAPGSGEDYRRGERYLQDLADRSGGKLFYADTTRDLSEAFSKIADELRYQYALSYYPSNSARDGSYRQIKVRVNRTGTIVRARDGYRATPDTQATTDDSKKEDRKRPGYKRRQMAGK